MHNKFSSTLFSKFPTPFFFSPQIPNGLLKNIMSEERYIEKVIENRVKEKNIFLKDGKEQSLRKIFFWKAKC